MKENKMASMDVKKLILNMSIPIMISMLIQALYNIVDSMFVARVSENALAAVSLCFPVQMMIIAVACGTGVGINALLSRRLGEKNVEEANQIALHGLFLSICSGIVFALFGLFFSRPFLSLFGDDPEILEMGISYMQICTIFSFGVFVQIAYERFTQATGHAIYNMVMQGAGALINIILDPIFIFGFFGIPAMGVSGAAIATVIGQIIAMLIGIWLVDKKVNEIQVKPSQFKINGTLIAQIYRIGIPAIIMQSIASVMTVSINMILTSFSILAVSVFNIYYKLQQFVFMAVLGMNNALIPIISFNYGARKKQRIKEAISFSLVLSLIIMAAGTLIFQLFPEQLLYLFDAKEEMLSIGIPAIKTISISFIFAGCSVVFCAIFQALDNAVPSLIITCLRQLILVVPITYILAKLFGLEMAWWAFPITEIICCILSIIFMAKVKRTKIEMIEE